MTRKELVQTTFHTITPYLIFRDAAKAIEFYKETFGATEITRILHQNGRIRHAEIVIGSSALMLVDENPDYPEMQSSEAIGNSPIHLYLYVPNSSELFQKAIANGATEVMPLAKSDDGEMRGGIRDPFGLVWWISTII